MVKKTQDVHLNRAKLITLCVCMAMSLNVATAADKHTLSWKAGTRDVNGARRSGTEILKITGHRGKLYACTSMWMESDQSLGGCQILIRENSTSDWKVDHKFDNSIRRATSLVSLTFSTDYRGAKIQPVNLLLAATTAAKNSSINVYSRDDASGKWIPMSLGRATGASQVRTLGFYRDKVTGIEMVLAGVSGTKLSPASLGLITGSYRQDAPGGIVWNRKAELKLPAGERFMEFTECNGVLYASSSNNIWKRTDGEKPKWVSVFKDSKLAAPVGVRGLNRLTMIRCGC